jgi:hypothetical protein
VTPAFCNELVNPGATVAFGDGKKSVLHRMDAKGGFGRKTLTRQKSGQPASKTNPMRRFIKSGIGVGSA